MPQRENERALNEFSSLRYCAKCDRFFPVEYWNGGHPSHEKPIIQKPITEKPTAKVSAEQWSSIVEAMRDAGVNEKKKHWWELW